jgi:hypothetical protein
MLNNSIKQLPAQGFANLDSRYEAFREKREGLHKRIAQNIDLKFGPAYGIGIQLSTYASHHSPLGLISIEDSVILRLFSR